MHIAIYDIEEKARKASELRQTVARLANLDGENVAMKLNSRVSATESGHTCHHSPNALLTHQAFFQRFWKDTAETLDQQP